MTVTPKIAPCCCLCWIDGIWSKAVDHWPGFPICREHLEESLERTNTSLDFGAPPAIAENVIDLAEMRSKLRPLLHPARPAALHQ
jgi:hypothetical protein